ncbi:MAG: pyruvate, phosphate dikinase [Proteobacteria bacterium]|nr:pyruvate, phosphate dikinase [Pseudomonadota bacterium]
MTSIYHIRRGLQLQEIALEDRLGKKAASLLELGAMGMPMIPGFLVEISKLKEAFEPTIRKIRSEGILSLEKETEKRFGDKSSPLTVRVSLLPDIVIDSVPRIPHLGLTNGTVSGLVDPCGEQSAYKAYRRLIERFSLQLLGYEKRDFQQAADRVVKNQHRTVCQYYLSELVPEFPQDHGKQLEMALRKMSDDYFAEALNRNVPASILIQYDPLGYRDAPLVQGGFFTRDVRTGEPPSKEAFPGTHHLKQKRLIKELIRVASILEKHFLDIRRVKFVVERNRVWILDQREVGRRSIHAKLRLLDDLLVLGTISKDQYVCSISPTELDSSLYPTIDPDSVKKLSRIQGGIAGSLGATRGKVYFSRKKLLEAYWEAKKREKNPSLILIKNRTYAEDVQAIEIGRGVVTSEGGYTSHAPIVARYLGKPSIVYPGIVFHENHILIDGHRIEEGQVISMEVPSSVEPSLYLGAAELERANIEHRDFQTLLAMAKTSTGGTRIMANADNPEEALYAKNSGADGIGLCRTEHMFLHEDRIQLFRELIVAETPDAKRSVLQKIQDFLTADFEKLFEIMAGKPVTIRLLDAPLHEFLPADEIEMEKTLVHFQGLPNAPSRETIRRLFDRSREINPMLGHRGCRIGISAPEIYEMQTAAILEAALKVVQDREIDVFPRIMIPFVMSEQEMRVIKNGKTIKGGSIGGVNGVVRKMLEKYKLDRLPFQLKTGAMIELPAAALSAGEIAKQAEFFSFGTNDLTQTTLGLSRDDANSFLPAYTEMDIWQKDPFRTLVDPVKELISSAVRVGRQIRPDLEIGICGEHGSDPDVVKYCLSLGMDTISCSPFSIPMVVLTLAQLNLSSE